jgi:hypothetical protein
LSRTSPAELDFHPSREAKAGADRSKPPLFVQRGRLTPARWDARNQTDGAVRYVRPVHGVPEDFDYSVFVGAGLERVCFGSYIVRLDFSSSEVPGPLYISIEGKYIHAGPDAEGWSDEVRLPAKSSRLMQLGVTLRGVATREEEHECRRPSPSASSS